MENKTKIYIMYKIVCKDLKIKDIYIGSTKNFRLRKWKHKSDCNCDTSKSHNFPLYKKIRETEWNNWDMIQIEEFECNTKQEAHTRERYWIEKLKATLNKCIPTRTGKEYRDENKEKRNENTRKWRLNNIEKRNEYQREYRQKNLEKMRAYDNERYHNGK